MFIIGIAGGTGSGKTTVVKKIVDDEGRIIKEFFPKKERIISREVSSHAKNILEKVVKYGTGRRAQIKGIKVAGENRNSSKDRSCNFKIF